MHQQFSESGKTRAPALPVFRQIGIKGAFMGAMALAAPFGAQAQQVDWSGPYAGWHIGYAEGREKSSTSVTNGRATTNDNNSDLVQLFVDGMAQSVPNVSTNPKGTVVGGHVGYNWQQGRLVYGLEADLQTSFKGSSAVRGQSDFIFGLPQRVNTDVSRSDTISNLSLWRGRVGYSFGNFLPFVDAGLAYGKVNSQFILNGSVKGSGTFGGMPIEGLDLALLGDPAVSNTTSAHFGWTVGAGVEYALGPRWRLRADYSYFDLGTQNNHLDYRFNNRTLSLSTANVGADINTRSTGNLWRVGVSYRF